MRLICTLHIVEDINAWFEALHREVTLRRHVVNGKVVSTVELADQRRKQAKVIVHYADGTAEVMPISHVIKKII